MSRPPSRALVGALAALAASAPGAAAQGYLDAIPDVRVRPIPETMVTTEDDYPPEARRAAQEGVVKLAIIVSAEGRVTACTVFRSSGVPALDKRSCALAFERFRFHPARRDGVAVEDKALLPVEWHLLEPGQPAPPG